MSQVMHDTLEDFKKYREKMNAKILASGNQQIQRFFNLRDSIPAINPMRPIRLRLLRLEYAGIRLFTFASKMVRRVGFAHWRKL